MGRSNRTTRLAAAAACNLWTRDLEADTMDPGARGNAARVGGTEGAARPESRVVSLIVPAFADLVAEYDREFLHDKAKGTRRHHRAVLRQATRALPPFPSDVQIREWLSGKVRSGKLAGSSANAYLGVLGRLYSTAGAAHGLPNPIRAIDAFAEAPPIPRALPADRPGGRLGVVERLCALACRNDVERALLWVLYDLGLRIEEALGLRLASDLDLAAGVVHVQGQRDPHAEDTRRAKTKGSHAKVNASPEAVEWILRAIRAPERRSWGGAWRGSAKRDRLAASFLFPFTQRGLDNLLRRIRAVEPAAFPRRNAWHVFRHSLASDMDDVRDADGRRIYSLPDIAERLRHTHGEWTRIYMDRLRGRECSTALDPLRAHRAAQRAEALAAAGVSVVGLTKGGTDAARDGAGARVVGVGNEGAPAAYGRRGGAVDPGAAGLAGVRAPIPGIPPWDVVEIPAQDTRNVRPLAREAARVVESAACNASRPAGCGWGSTHDTRNGNTPHDRSAAPAPAVTQRGLPLGPLGIARAPRSRSRKGGAR